MTLTSLYFQSFKGRSIQVSEGSVWSGVPKLFIDGQEVKPVKGKYQLTDRAGNVFEAKFKGIFLLDPANTLVIGNESAPVKMPLTKGQYVFACLPLVLVFLGGVIGGGIGGAAACGNIGVFRSSSGSGKKYFLTSLITFGAVFAWLVIAGSLHLAFTDK